jgi:polyphosphate kinase 2
MSKHDGYGQELEALQAALVRFQMAAIKSGEKSLVIFEGRDAAGKDGAIKRITEHLSVRNTRAVALPKPTEREQSQWYFQRYVRHLPAAGEFVLLNRSWYNRAGVEHVMGFADADQYREFMRQTPQFEQMLARDGIILIKFWFSVSRSEQQTRFIIRRIDPVRQWKLSPIDLASLDKWDDYSEAKEAMFYYTDTPHAPWTVVKSNDKKRARIEAMRHVLSRLDYTDKDAEIVGQPDPAIVGPAAYVLETGERADRSFPDL